jgi:hypothetical protein
MTNNQSNKRFLLSPNSISSNQSHMESLTNTDNEENVQEYCRHRIAKPRTPARVGIR